MKYSQSVKIKKVDFDIVKSSFHRIDFVRFLTYLQPVKILEWSGIKNGCVAYFKLWFFGWKKLKVIHKDYINNESHLKFVDQGLELPFGLSFWHHTHIVENNKKYITITDNLIFSHNNYIIGLMIYPMMIAPIVLRRFLYKMYFRKNSKNIKGFT